ncbi:integrase core domain-containing protein, partial [Autumnicola edwardsiae]
GWNNISITNLRGFKNLTGFRFKLSHRACRDAFLKTLTEARKMIKKVVYLYNNERPHGSLKNKKPQEFANLVQQLTAEQRPIFKISY